MSTDSYKPRPEHKFSFGLWTVGNRGRDPFGDAVRPPVKPVDLVHLLGEIGAWGVNLHDNDLVPIDATIAERNQIVRDFKKACDEATVVTSMVTANLFLIRSFAMEPLPQMMPMCELMHFKKRCGQWI